MPLNIGTINEDVLLSIFSYLEPPEILSMRKTCKRLSALSNLRSVWTNACIFNIHQKGYPFPCVSLGSMSIPELERHTCNAFSLASRWLSQCFKPRVTCYIDATSNIPVSEIRFVPGHEEQWILTVSKSVWDVITIWDVSAEEPRRCCEWSLRGATFNGFALNADSNSQAMLAVSVLNDGEHVLDIFTVEMHVDGTYHFRILNSIQSNLKPITLQGDLLAVSDDVAQTVIWDWRAGTSAILEHRQDGFSRHNNCIQVVFATDSILVVRARFIHLFPKPKLHSGTPQIYTPIAQHSFGWTDGVSVAPARLLPGSSSNSLSLSILIQGELNDPWSSERRSLDLFTLHPNPSYSSSPSDTNTGKSPVPYIFPPTLTTQVHTVRGSLRCRNFTLGRCGTAVWIHPRDLMYETTLCDLLVVAAFPGPLAASSSFDDSDSHASSSVTQSIQLHTNYLHNSWTSLDYDEERGRIVLGSSYGPIMILEF